jgi:hypothetical protein
MPRSHAKRRSTWTRAFAGRLSVFATGAGKEQLDYRPTLHFAAMFPREFEGDEKSVDNS